MRSVPIIMKRRTTKEKDPTRYRPTTVFLRFIKRLTQLLYPRCTRAMNPSFFFPLVEEPSSSECVWPFNHQVLRMGTSVCLRREDAESEKPTARDKGKNIPLGIPPSKNAGANPPKLASVTNNNGKLISAEASLIARALDSPVSKCW